MKRLAKITLTLAISCLLSAISLYAQQDKKLADLSKCLIEAEPKEGLLVSLEEAGNIYLADNKYSEFVDFLKSLRNKNKTIKAYLDYYIALTRYNQLKYLEENQVWDEYFDKGNTYREEIIQNAESSLEGLASQESLYVYSRLLLWQFHKSLEDVFADGALTDLMNSVLEYAESKKDIKPIKEAADKLSSLGQRRKAKDLYKIYVDRLLSSDIKDDELKTNAEAFYKEGNLDLAQSLYDAYIDRIIKALPKEKAVSVLFNIAGVFIYRDEGVNDPYYAEKIFSKIEGLYGKGAFDKDLIYARAYNLEKTKDYSKAKDSYIDLIMLYPKTSYTDEALYKLGIIFTYALGNRESGEVYFQELAKREINFSGQVISAFYQLGLLSQWEDDPASARKYYSKLIELAGDNYSEKVVLARKRLNEIDKQEPVEYNLKTFLDACLKDEYSMLDMTRVDLKSKPYKAKQGESISIESTPYGTQTGCFQVNLDYLWSGDTGSTSPSPSQMFFETSYDDPGTKEIFLVVVSPSGIVERSLDLLDIR